MRRAVASIFLFMMLVLVACGSSSDDNNNDEVIQQPVTQRATIPAFVPNATPTLTFGIAPTSTVSNIGSTFGTNPTNNCPVPSGWQAYIVSSGDTLSGIATVISSTVALIQEGNCLTGEGIFAGQLLFLPSIPAGIPTVDPAYINSLSFVPTTQTGVTFPTATPTAFSCSAPPAWVQYTVVAGDTLGLLAESTNTTVGSLQNGNCLGGTELIYVGQTLYLPRYPGTVTTPVINSSPTPNTGCNIPFGWQPYTIRAGDTLGLLAEQSNTTIEILQNGNCLPNAELIYIGQQIYLPPVGVVLPTSTSTSTVLSPLPTSTNTPANLGGDPPAVLPEIVVRPTITRDDGVLVTLQQSIALDVGVVTDADRVVYLAQTSPSDPSPVQIGVDDDPFDGTQITYDFSEFDPDLYFYAFAQNEFGTSTSPLIRVVYDPTATIGSGVLFITPRIGFDGTIYTLEGDATVTISWFEAPSNAVRVDFYVRENGTERLIGSDPNPSDGANITWVVSAPLQGELYARAILGTNQSTQSDSVLVYAEDFN